MKYFIILLPAFIALGLVIHNYTKKKREKERIITAIADYKDSIGRKKAALVLSNNAQYFADARGEVGHITLGLDERMAINKKIWNYQWKIDSLEIALKKY